MEAVQRLANPPGVVAKTQFEFRQVTAGGAARDATAETLLALLRGGGGDGSDDSGAGSGLQAGPLPLSVPEVPVLEPQQLRELADFLLTGAPLPWPRPRFSAGLKTHLAFASHAALFGAPGAAAGNGNGSSNGSSNGSIAGDGVAAAAAAAVGAARPKVEGRSARNVAVLRDYLGAALLHAYELRRLALRKLVVSSSGSGGADGGGAFSFCVFLALVFAAQPQPPTQPINHSRETTTTTIRNTTTATTAALLDLDADLYLAAYDRAVMLEWIDVLWSCFLEVPCCRRR
jgi:hypothetical protein